MYLTALSLYEERSSVAVSWTDGSATFGATFVGPNPQFVLADKVFGLPVISLNDSIPKEISVSFKFHDTTHSVSSPATANVGPQGNGKPFILKLSYICYGSWGSEVSKLL